MAVIGWVVENSATAGTMDTGLPRGVKVIRWTLPAVNDTGAPYPAPAHSDKTIQVSGTLAGSTVTIQGTNQISAASAPYETLHDAFGTVMAYTTTAMALIAENPYQIRPTLTGGADANIVIRMCIKDPGV